MTCDIYFLALIWFSFLLFFLYILCVNMLRTWVARFKWSLWSLGTTCHTISWFIYLLYCLWCVCGEPIWFDRLIMSVKYCLPVPVFHFWPKLTHPAARSLCDSWASCIFCFYCYFGQNKWWWWWWWRRSYFIVVLWKRIPWSGNKMTSGLFLTVFSTISFDNMTNANTRIECKTVSSSPSRFLFTAQHGDASMISLINEWRRQRCSSDFIVLVHCSTFARTKNPTSNSGTCTPIVLVTSVHSFKCGSPAHQTGVFPDFPDIDKMLHVFLVGLFY